MSIDACKKKLKDFYGEKIEDKYLNRYAEVLGEIEKRTEGVKFQQLELAREAAKTLKFGILKTSVDNLDHLTKLKANLERIILDGNTDKVDSLAALILGSYKNGKGSEYTIEGTWNTQKQSGIDLLHGNLKKYGVEAEATVGKWDRETVIDLFNRDKPNYTPSPHPIVRGLSDSFSKVNDYLLTKRTVAGARFKRLSSYVTRLSHDFEAITERTDEWVKDIIDKLDWKESFGFDYVDKNYPVAKKILEKMALEIESVGDGIFSAKSFYGGKRQLIFKGGGEFYDYTQKWSPDKTLYESVMHNIDKSSSIAAMEQILGPYHARAIKELTKYVEKIDPKNASHIKRVERFYDYVRGVGRTGDSTVFDIIQKMKSAVSLPVMGFSGIKQIMLDSVPAMYQIMNQRGGGLAASPVELVKSMKDVLLNVIPSDRQAQAMKLVGVSLDAHSKYVMEQSGMGVDGKVSGMLGKATSTYFWLNLMTPTGRARRVAAAKANSSALKEILLLDPKNLNPFEKNTLDRIGLDQNETNFLRDLAKFTDSDGITKYDIVDDAGNFASKYSSDPVKFKSVLEDKIGSSYYYKVNQGSSTPTGMSQVAMGRHIPKDNWQRWAFEIGMHFQGSLIQIMGTTAKTMRGVGNGRMWTPSSTALLGGGIAYSTALYILFDHLKQWQNNKEPPEITKDYILSSMLRGGVALPYMDALTSYKKKSSIFEFSKDIPMPPVAQAVAGVGNIVSYLLEGEEEKAKKEATRLIPGNNLWFNHALFHEMLGD
jgi:hypothetical protein